METSLAIDPPGATTVGTWGDSSNTGGDGCLSYKGERDLVAHCVIWRYKRREAEQKQQPTLVREVHGVRGADVNVCDEPLADKFVHLVEVFEYYVAGDVNLARAVHDKDGVSLATLEQPLSLDRCTGDTWDIPVVICTRS